VSALGLRGIPRQLVVGAVMSVAIGTTLSACGGNSGTALAKQACTHVDRSIVLLGRSDHQTDLSKSAGLRQQAYIELRKALPIAAEAAYHDGQWQALMTTVSESNRVGEATLVTSLEAQCAQADNSTFGQSPPPSSIPPPAPVSSSP